MIPKSSETDGFPDFYKDFKPIRESMQPFETMLLLQWLIEPSYVHTGKAPRINFSAEVDPDKTPKEVLLAPPPDV